MTLFTQFWRTHIPLFCPKAGSFAILRTHIPLLTLFTRFSLRLQANNGTSVREAYIKACLFTNSGTTVREILLYQCIHELCMQDHEIAMQTSCCSCRARNRFSKAAAEQGDGRRYSSENRIQVRAKQYDSSQNIMISNKQCDSNHNNSIQPKLYGFIQNSTTPAGYVLFFIIYPL